MMKQTSIIRSLLCMALLVCVVPTAGCPLFLAGAGAGAGVYTYLDGELTRSYPADLNTAVTAAKTGLNDLKLTITGEKRDGAATRIACKQANGTPVAVKLKRVAPKVTEISIRTGVLGVWDKNVSELIHATIAQRLQ